jgi:hypothetical protein
MQSSMIKGAFVLKLKTRQWRLCIVKQVPEDPASCFMLFGQNTGNDNKSTFQMEFQPHRETTLVNYLADMTEADEAELRLVMVSDPPGVSCFESLWSLQGQCMYRKKVRAAFISNALYQDLNMLRLSPQLSAPPMESRPMKSRPMKSLHSMQTRSKSS